MTEEKTDGLFFDSDGKPNPVHSVIFFIINSVVIGGFYNSIYVSIIVFAVYLCAFSFLYSQKNEEA